MKQLKGKIKSVAVPLMLAAGDGGTFTGWASTNEPDRYGEIVDPEAFVKHLPKFEANPVMLYQHRVDQPIGSFPVVRVDPAKGLRVRGQLGSGWVAADEARAQVAQGVLRACSIGLRGGKEARKRLTVGKASIRARHSQNEGYFG